MHAPVRIGDNGACCLGCIYTGTAAEQTDLWQTQHETHLIPLWIEKIQMGNG